MIVKAGKKYTMEVTGGSAVFLTLELNGTRVAQQNGFGRNVQPMVFRPASNGIYRLVVNSQRGNAERFILRVREE